MKYIITGGAGFIGSHLCESLVSLGHEIIIIDDLSSGRIENLSNLIHNSFVSFYEETILNQEKLLEIFRGADGVFHLAALVSVQKSIDNPALSHAVTLTGTLNILIAARDAGIKKVVSASSAAIYGNLPELPKRENSPIDPESPYAVDKHCLEEYSRIFSRLYGLSTVCLRYFNVYGPRQDPYSDYAAVIPKFIHKIKSGESPLIYGDGEQTRDFIYVKDVVQANILAMSSMNATGVYNIASGKATSVRNLADLLLTLFRSRKNPIFTDGRIGEVKHSVADILKAKQQFGFEPKYNLEIGLEKMIE